MRTIFEDDSQLMEARKHYLHEHLWGLLPGVHGLVRSKTNAAQRSGKTRVLFTAMAETLVKMARKAESDKAFQEWIAAGAPIVMARDAANLATTLPLASLI